MIGKTQDCKKRGPYALHYMQMELGIEAFYWVLFTLQQLEISHP